MKLERIIAIIMLLLQQETVKARHLAELFEVSLRTIYRDIDTISSAGIPIVATSGPHGGIGIMKGYKFEKRIFTTDDIIILLTGLGIVSDTWQKDAANTLAKIKSLVPQDKLADISFQASQIVFDSSPWMKGSAPPALETIKTALQTRCLLSFQYRARQAKETKRTAEPHRLVWKDGNWYLLAFCHTRQSFRIFKVSRIHGLQMLQQHFTPKEIPSAPPEFYNSMKKRQEIITLAVHETVLDRVLDFCYSTPQPLEQLGWFEVAFPFIEDEYGYGILLSFGPGCRCTSPEKIRQGLAARLAKMQQHYIE